MRELKLKSSQRIPNWRILHLALAFGLVLALAVFALHSVQAMPLLPQNGHNFWGNVTSQGATVPAGTVVIAEVVGSNPLLSYSTTVDTLSRYGYTPLFRVPADDPDTKTVVEGAKNGQTINFYLQPAGGTNKAFANSYIFAIGGATRLDLEADVTPPTVSEVSPLAGATNVPDSIAVSATFSEAITLADATKVTMVGSITGNLIALNGVTLDALENTLDIAHLPFSPLGEHVVVTLGAGAVTDAAGNPNALYTWEFDTVATAYTVTVTASTGGQVYYNGAPVVSPVVVNAGSTPQFVFTPDTGYAVSAVKVNGVALPNGAGMANYTFPAVTANQTLDVTFAKLTFTVTVTASSGGQVFYGGAPVTSPVTVQYGDAPQFVFVPDTGKMVSAVKVNGVALPNGSGLAGYTFAAVTANQTLEVTFTQAPATTFTITATVNGDGKIMYNGAAVTAPVTVNAGSTPQFSFTPGRNFAVKEVKVNGVVVPNSANMAQYTFTAVTANQTIEVTFVQVNWPVLLPIVIK